MKTIIHVNRHILAANRKHGRDDPPLTLRTYKGGINAHEIEVQGKVVFKHSPDKPLKCGARVWVETHDEVKEGPRTAGPICHARQYSAR